MKNNLCLLQKCEQMLKRERQMLLADRSEVACREIRVEVKHLHPQLQTGRNEQNISGNSGKNREKIPPLPAERINKLML